MTSLLEYYKEVYGLNEMPDRIDSFRFRNDDQQLNLLDGREVEKNDAYDGDFKLYSFTFRRFYKKEGNDVFYNLLESSQPRICLTHDLYIKDDGVVSKSIWVSRSMRGIGTHWVRGFILKKYKFIESDSYHTPSGEGFWKRLLEECKKEGFLCKIVDDNGESEFNENDFSKYYHSGKTRFRIEN